MVDYTYYSAAGSKGLSYLVPYTVQATLLKILKTLPTVARPIYREYYGDIMATRVRAQESADAMAKFVDDFPAISRTHNRLANLMNAEIEEQKGSNAIKFQVVGDGTTAEDGDEDGHEGQVALPQRRNVVNARQTKSAKEVVAPEDDLIVEVKSGLREQSATMVSSPTIANTEFGGPAVAQSPVTSPASPTILNTEHTEVDENNSEMSAEPLDAPEPWDDSLWVHGAWIDGLEVIDTLPRARRQNTGPTIRL
jgi:hypothetical protein